MTLAPATRLGPYEVIEPLGAGGMGEVYRGRDTRLGREVAIKVLPVHLSENAEVRARFEREARTISGLNHPNICTLYDVGREGDTDYLVMELVDGETLAERLRRGPLPAVELLRIGSQIADALDRAHRAGVIHRDLKPANVMITRSGAKLMDFGLARATGLAAGGDGRTAGMSHSPTIAQSLTSEGSLIGTFQYMSPELLEGREADLRSDLWALGCVLYEMATGRRAFDGRSQASLIAAILEREPPSITGGTAPDSPGGARSSMSGVRASVALPELDRLIRALLVKDPEERMQTAHDARLQLQWISESAGLTGTGSGVSARGAIPQLGGPQLSWIPWAVAGVGLAVAVAVIVWALPRVSASPPVYRFRVDPIPNLADTFWPRISPDGRFLVMTGVDSAGVPRAYVRRMDQTEANPIPGTNGLRRPYWSPDGREIAFVSNDRLLRVPIGGGSPVLIAPANGGVDLSWGAKGHILIDGLASDSIRVVPAGGGELRPAVRVDRAAGEIGNAWPHFLPDGEHYLFIGNTRNATSGGNLRLGKLGSLDSKRLGTVDGRAEYSNGWVLFVRGGSLLAQRLDVGGGRLTGEPITIASNLRVGSSSGHFSVSHDGVIAFARQVADPVRVLREVDRDGRAQGGPIVTGAIVSPSLSNDGRRLLYQRIVVTGDAGGEIFVFDLVRRTDTRLTFTNNNAATPVWSPDGRRVAYSIDPLSANTRLRITSPDGLGLQDSVSLPTGGALWQWADSELVFFSRELRPFAVRADGPRPTPRSLLADSSGRFAQPAISPDGRWLAGMDGNVARSDVFVRSLGAAGRWQISTSSAMGPRWTRNGRELVYEGRDNTIVAVDIDVAAGFQAGTPHTLFRLPWASDGMDRWSWTCSADGARFFVIEQVGNSQQTVIEVVSDFTSLVTRR